MPRIRIRAEQPDVTLSREEFERRFRARFDDPAFEGDDALDRVLETAYEAYRDYRKNPRTKPAGASFADPTFELPVEWLAARSAIRTAERRRRDPRSPSRILLVSASARSNQTCPGETPKTFRMAKLAQAVFEERARFEVDLLDLSVLTSEYGRVIYPCKACVSTAMPLCHWPCSCYPNHAMGQSGDWMNEIYPRWAAAHGVMIVTPVNWFHVPSVLKLMIDRLVCADGGNPDPTSTEGKDPRVAKKLELAGWHYPQHLAGRGFAVVVHADTDGATGARRQLCDWLTAIGMIQAGPFGAIDGYVGYYEPYATSHDAFDREPAFQEEIRNAARSLAKLVTQLRAGKCPPPHAGLERARKK